MIKSATGTTFAAQKQESPDAKVSCLSKEYMYAIMQINLWLYKSEFVISRWLSLVKQYCTINNVCATINSVLPQR